MVDQYVVDGGISPRLVNPQAAGGLGLRVHIDQEHPLAVGGQVGAQVNGGRCLADPSLLVRQGVDLPHWLLHCFSTGHP
jgi:hypothetical protein